MTASSSSSKSQQVGDGRPRAADRLRGPLVRHAEFDDQPFEGARLVERTEVFALNVLDQRQRQRYVVRHVAHDDRHLAQARHLRGPPAPLAGDDLVARTYRRVRAQGGARRSVASGLARGWTRRDRIAQPGSMSPRGWKRLRSSSSTGSAPARASLGFRCAAGPISASRPRPRPLRLTVMASRMIQARGAGAVPAGREVCRSWSYGWSCSPLATDAGQQDRRTEHRHRGAPLGRGARRRAFAAHQLIRQREVGQRAARALVVEHYRHAEARRLG